MLPYPASTSTLVLRPSKIPQNPLYHDARVETRPVPALEEGQILVQTNACSFNHRDLWIRRGKYPGIVLGAVFGSDGAGVVTHTSDPQDPLLNRRVFFAPMRGWIDAPDGPESEFGTLGCAGLADKGTFSRYLVVEREQVVLSPDHLDDVHVAAWSVAGLTAWRAVFYHARITEKYTVLITGIGGGVALQALQLCVAKGAAVYVTSGHPEKIKQAVNLGARGGVCYHEADWPAQLGRLMKDHAIKQGESPTLLDAVIDSGGGEIMRSVERLLRAGGKVVVYGMTAAPEIKFTMRQVLKHHELIGTTCGSYADLVKATSFLSEHRIIPVVSTVLHGLHDAESGFDLMAAGAQFGKIVVDLNEEGAKARL